RVVAVEAVVVGVQSCERRDHSIPLWLRFELERAARVGLRRARVTQQRAVFTGRQLLVMRLQVPRCAQPLAVVTTFERASVEAVGAARRVAQLRKVEASAATVRDRRAGPKPAVRA